MMNTPALVSATRRAIWAFPLALAFLTSFAVSHELMDGITKVKTLFFFVAFAVCILVYSLRLLFLRNPLTLRINWLDASVFLFWAFFVVRALFTPYTSLTDQSVIVFSLVVCLYFFFKFFLERENDRVSTSQSSSIQVLSAAFLLSGLLQAVYGLLQLYGHDPLSISNYFKLQGTFGNPDAYAGYLASIMPFALGVSILFPSDEGIYSRFKYLGGATFLTSLLVLPATMIRSSWLAVAAGVIVISFYKYDLRDKIKSYFQRKTLAVGAVLAGGLILTALMAGLYTLKPDSAKGRLLIWKITSQMISEDPLFGIGFDRYAVEYGNTQAAYFAGGSGTPYEEQRAGNVQQAHNEYLQVLAEGGVVGFLIAMSVLLLAFGMIRRARSKTNENRVNSENPLLIAARASLVALLVSSFFSFPVHIVPTAINLVFLLSLTSRLGRYKSAVEFVLVSKRLRQLGYVGIVIVLFAALSLRGLYRGYVQWNNAFTKALSSDFESAAKEYESLEAHFEGNGKFLFMYGGALGMAGEHYAAIQVLEDAKKTFNDPNLWTTLGQNYEAVGNYVFAEKHYVHASNMIPHKLYPKYLLAKMYQKNGRGEDACRIAKAIVQANEKVQTMAANEMKAEMQTLLESQQTH